MDGCPVCGAKLAKIRGRFPKSPEREVCPTCLQERLEDLHNMSDPDYHKTYTQRKGSKG